MKTYKIIILTVLFTSCINIYSSETLSFKIDNPADWHTINIFASSDYRFRLSSLEELNQINNIVDILVSDLKSKDNSSLDVQSFFKDNKISTKDKIQHRLWYCYVSKLINSGIEVNITLDNKDRKWVMNIIVTLDEFHYTYKNITFKGIKKWKLLYESSQTSLIH